MSKKTFSSKEIYTSVKGEGSPSTEQQQIIEYGLSPLLVVAGAGSGKTETLAFRVMSLILNHNIAPHQVLALTFTRKATGEMATRLNERLSALRQVKNPLHPTDLEKAVANRSDIESPVEVATYDSFANRLVAEYGALAGFTPLRLMEEAQEYQLMHQVVSDFCGTIAHGENLNLNTLITRALKLERELGAFSVEAEEAAQVYSRYLKRATELRCDLDKAMIPFQNAQRTPNGVSGAYGVLDSTIEISSQRLSLLEVVEQYRHAKKEHGYATFNDQTACAYDLAQKQDIVAALRNRYRVVLLDEFQDTSVSQMKFLGALFNGHPVTAVGDPNQAIYAWRGASANSMGQFDNFFASEKTPAKHLSLTTAWRNDRSILQCANTVIRHFKASKDTELLPLQAPEGADPGNFSLSLCASAEHQAQTIAHFFKEHWEGKNQAPKPGKQDSQRRTGAVLVREHSQSPLLARVLREAGLKVQVWAQDDLLTTRPAALIRSLLSVATSPHRGDALMSLLDAYSISPADLQVLWTGVRQREPVRDLQRLSLVLEPWFNLDRYCPELSPLARQRLDWLSEIVQLARKSLQLPLESLVSLMAMLLGLDTDPDATVREIIQEFRHFTRDFAANSEDPSVEVFVDYLDWKIEQRDTVEMSEPEVDPNAIMILTTFAAKGLEWDVVAVADSPDEQLGAKDPKTLDALQFRSSEKPWFMAKSVKDAVLPSGLRGYGEDDAMKDISLELNHGTYKSGQNAGKPKLTAKIHVETATELAGDTVQDNQRRLAYVAFTRAKTHLLYASTWYKKENKKPALPSIFMSELWQAGVENLDENSATDTNSWVNIYSEVHQLAPSGEISPSWIPDFEKVPKANPDLALARNTYWPELEPSPDPLRQAQFEIMHQLQKAAQDYSDTDTLTESQIQTNPLLERARRIWESNQRDQIETQRWRLGIEKLSVTDIAHVITEGDLFQKQKLRPLPQPSSPAIQLGNDFHAWVQHWWTHRGHGVLEATEFDQTLIPGSPRALELEKRQLSFQTLPFKDNKVPLEIETAYQASLQLTTGDFISVNLRMDAVLQDSTDNTVWIVDWKTGRPPKPEDYTKWIHQLGIYRLVYISQHPEFDPAQLRSAYIFVAADPAQNRILDLEEICAELGLSQYDDNYLTLRLEDARAALPHDIEN